MMRVKSILLVAIGFSGILSWAPANGQPAVAAEKLAAASDDLDRTVLPIPEPNIPHSTVFDARNATPPPRFQVKAPAGAQTC